MCTLFCPSWEANLSPNVKNFLNFADEAEELPAILSIVDNMDDVTFARFIDDIEGQPRVFYEFLGGGAGRVRAWEILDDAGTALKTDVIALGKIDFLKTHGLSDAQLLKIGQLDDIKAINIADDLAKRTNPSVPLNQLDLIPSNAKALEGVRPTIMDEIGSMASNPNLKNPDELHGFLSNAKNPGNINKTGWKYELDVANEKLGSGANIDFSKTVAGKEIDILDYTGSRIVEVKSYSSGNWTTIAKKLGDDVGAQVGSIDNALKSQFTEHVGRVRIEPSGNSTWLNASKQDLIQEIQSAVTNPTWGAGVKANMDNMTHIVIENSTGIHTIEKVLWQ